MLASLGAVLLAAAAVRGQSVEQQIAAFSNANIVPNIIPSYQPTYARTTDRDADSSSGYARFAWDNISDVTAGTQLPPSRLRVPPAVFFNGTGSASGTSNATYLLFTIDPDAPTPQNASRANILHWAVSDLKAGRAQDVAR